MSSSAQLAVTSDRAADSGTSTVAAPRTSPRLVETAPPANEPSGDRTGRVLHDTYRIERLVAEGGMGAVYEAVHVRLQQRFALKVLDHQLARNAEAYARFRQEAEIAAALNHPNIVQVFDFNHDEAGNPYMVMEYVEGTTLGEHAGRRKLPLREAVRLIEPLAHALDSAHRAGIVHRDLKPNNIMVRRTPTGAAEVKLLDFGISKMRDANTGMTSDNVVMGTPNYMSPEQASGKTREVDARTDIFALGTILYEILAGRRAFDQRTTPELLHAIVYEEPTALSTLRPDLPAGVCDVVTRCLAKEPDNRVRDAREFVRLLREGSRPARPRTEAKLPPPPVQRRRPVAMIGLWVASVAVAAGGAFFARPAAPAAPSVVQPEPAAVALAAEVPGAPEPAPSYGDELATPGALLLAHGPALYRADRRGLTLWVDPEAPEKVRALPTASPATALARGGGGEILVGQQDGTVSRWDHELREPSWHRKIGESAVVAVASGADYLAVSTGQTVELLNGRTGRSLRRFPGRSPVVELLITKGPSPKLLVIRPDAVEVYDTDRRKQLARHTWAGRAVRAGLGSQPLDGPAELWVDFDQGQWRVRRHFGLSSDRRGNKWRLDPQGADRL